MQLLAQRLSSSTKLGHSAKQHRRHAPQEPSSSIQASPRSCRLHAHEWHGDVQCACANLLAQSSHCCDSSLTHPLLLCRQLCVKPTQVLAVSANHGTRRQSAALVEQGSSTSRNKQPWLMSGQQQHWPPHGMQHAAADDWYAAVQSGLETCELKHAVKQVLQWQHIGTTGSLSAPAAGKKPVIQVQHKSAMAGYAGSCTLWFPAGFQLREHVQPGLVLQQESEGSSMTAHLLDNTTPVLPSSQQLLQLQLTAHAPCNKWDGTVHKRLEHQLWAGLAAVLLWLLRPTSTGMVDRRWACLCHARPRALSATVAAAPSSATRCEADSEGTCVSSHHNANGAEHSTPP